MRNRSQTSTWRALVLKLLRVHVDGASTAPIWARVASRPHIVCANHVSMLDGIVIALASPVPLTFAVDPAYSRHSPVARLGLALLSKAGLGNVVPMDMGSPFGLRALRRALDAGRSVMVFPEGRISPDGRPQPLLPGAIWLHRASAAPVVWFSIAGAERSRLFAKAGRRWWPAVTVTASPTVLTLNSRRESL